MEDVDILSVRDLLAILRRRWSIVVVTVLICVGAAGMLSYVVLSPVYRSETSLVVTRRQPTPTGDSASYDQLQAYHALALTYAEIITSRAVLQDTIDTLRLPETVEQLAKMTAAEVAGDTGVILVSVRDTDSTRAALIANTVASSFVDQLPKLLSRNDSVSVIDRAVPMTDQVTPRPLLNIAVALAGSLMLGIVLAFLVDSSDDTIRTTGDVQRLFGLRVLAVVPDVRANGGHGNWGEGSLAFESFSALRTSLQFSMPDHEPQVIL
ncbi:MAG TPA: Wzz/FepE/Etk N-terminal domain-containing protein, partial [Clostridia bacterium]|nr:Wzz/FepE/Etk N-terminal domain-containing protein [Clostridia bacterium]